MTKKRLIVGLLLLAVLGYLALFVFDRWNADINGIIAEIQPVEIGILMLVDTDRKTVQNPTGRIPVLLTGETELIEENYLRTRRPASLEALRPGKKVVIQYFSTLARPATPYGRQVSQVLFVKF